MGSAPADPSALYAGIIFFASLGAYAVNLQSFDLVLLLVFGVLGFFMRRFGLPVLPLIIGVIIGPRAEIQLRRALQGAVETQCTCSATDGRRGLCGPAGSGGS